jgi:hypothetical protein
MVFHHNPDITVVVGRKQEKTLQLLGAPAQGSSLSGSVKKAKPRPKQPVLGASQGWTLKSVFRFFHSTSVFPKDLRFFLLFPGQLWYSARLSKKF